MTDQTLAADIVERPRITREQFKMLPENVRRYIMYIETDCDPSGTIRSEMHLRDLVDALESLSSERATEIEALRAREAELQRELAESKAQFDEHVKWASDQSAALQRNLAGIARKARVLLTENHEVLTVTVESHIMEIAALASIRGG